MPQLDAIQSAETVAALRALAGSEAGLVTPCRDLFARHFLSLKNRLLLNFAPQGLLRSVIERMSPGSYCFTIARTRHFDEALLAGVRAGVKQVVILGAGYDSRDVPLQGSSSPACACSSSIIPARRPAS